MKETYRIPRPPEIACNADLVDGNKSDEILSVLGFCNSGNHAEAEALDGEPQVLNEIESTCSRPDRGDQVYEMPIRVRIGREEVDARIGAM